MKTSFIKEALSPATLARALPKILMRNLGRGMKGTADKLMRAGRYAKRIALDTNAGITPKQMAALHQAGRSAETLTHKGVTDALKRLKVNPITAASQSNVLHGLDDAMLPAINRTSPIAKGISNAAEKTISSGGYEMPGTLIGLYRSLFPSAAAARIGANASPWKRFAHGFMSPYRGIKDLFGIPGRINAMAPHQQELLQKMMTDPKRYQGLMEQFGNIARSGLPQGTAGTIGKYTGLTAPIVGLGGLGAYALSGDDEEGPYAGIEDTWEDHLNPLYAKYAEAGFIDKCAEYGVDPEEVIKYAQAQEGMLGPAGIYGSPHNIEYQAQQRAQVQKALQQALSSDPNGTMQQLQEYAKAKGLGPEAFQKELSMLMGGGMPDPERLISKSSNHVI